MFRLTTENTSHQIGPTFGGQSITHTHRVTDWEETGSKKFDLVFMGGGGAPPRTVPHLAHLPSASMLRKSHWESVVSGMNTSLVVVAAALSRGAMDAGVVCVLSIPIISPPSLSSAPSSPHLAGRVFAMTPHTNPLAHHKRVRATRILAAVTRLPIHVGAFLRESESERERARARERERESA
jgi:hypothetical protein